MQPPQQHSWMNLGEIKGQLIKKLGIERSKQYLDYLNLFLSLKLTKPEFDKLCLKTIGKDNIRLHNQLIRTVLKNACTRKTSILPNDPSIKKPLHQNGVTNTIPLSLTNGDILPPSPRKARSGTRERRLVDRKSTLGPNGKTNSNVVLENGKLSPETRYTQSRIHHQEFKKQKEQEKGEFFGVNERASLHLHAPLGVPFCPVSVGGAHGIPSGGKTVNVLHTDGLLETPTLKERMEEIVTTQVSMECANVMNMGLDSYLKGLIKSCIELNGGKSMEKSTKGDLVKHPKRVVTLLDFRVAMDINPKQIGEDWPLVLEKICTHDFEE